MFLGAHERLESFDQFIGEALRFFVEVCADMACLTVGQQMAIGMENSETAT
jgi:hypothetical protein